MSDLISRNESITKLREYAEQKHICGQIELANGILKAVNFLEKESNILTLITEDELKALIEKEENEEQPIINTWIPCSERLPQSTETGEMILHTDIEGEVTICCLDWFYDNIENMVAWQPLPEPYKPE